MNYFELKDQLQKRFINVGIDEFSDIDWIICEITGKQRSFLPFLRDFSNDELRKIYKAIEMRLEHIPIAYIFGKTNFYGRDFIVTRDTLIPRLDTEILIERILCEIDRNNLHKNRNLSILDIGTGTGAIAISLEREIVKKYGNCLSKVVGVDISESAVNVAKANVKSLNSSVEVLQSDLFENLNGEKYDIIVSNPPYIKTSVIEQLDSEVKDNEPILALDGGADGLYFYKKIINESREYLSSVGMLFFEIGYDQAEDLKKLMKDYFENIIIIKDYSGNDRVIFGKLRSNL